MVLPVPERAPKPRCVELFLSAGTFEGGRSGGRTQVLTDVQGPPIRERLAIGGKSRGPSSVVPA